MGWSGYWRINNNNILKLPSRLLYYRIDCGDAHAPIITPECAGAEKIYILYVSSWSFMEKWPSSPNAALTKEDFETALKLVFDPSCIVRAVCEEGVYERVHVLHLHVVIVRHTCEWRLHHVHQSFNQVFASRDHIDCAWQFALIEHVIGSRWCVREEHVINSPWDGLC